MTYPIFPRKVDSSGMRAYRLRFGTERSEFSARGVGGWRASRAKIRHEVELSWNGVGRTHLDPIETILDTTLGVGLVVCPTFQREIVTAQAWDPSSDADIVYDDGYAFLKTKDLQSSFITIQAGVNDKINFRETSGGAEKTATLTANVYDRASLCTNIVAQMDAASAIGNVYSATFSLQDDRFTISTSDAFLQLLGFSGTNAATNALKQLGFDISRDLTGKTSYSSQFFKMPFGSRLLVSDPSDNFATTQLVEVFSHQSAYDMITTHLNTGQYSAPAQPASHTYPVGSIIEPVFNAYTFLPDQDQESVWGHESEKGRRGIVQSSIRLVESFNA